MKSKVILASLFEKGSLFVCKPILIKYLIEPADKFSIQATFSVPKRRFKLAVDRNRLKRKIREAHRLHQNPLKAFAEKQNFKISILYIYNVSRMENYATIEKSIQKFMQQLLDHND